MDAQIQGFYPILLYVVVIVGFVVTTLILTHLPRVKPGKETQVKSMPYESGMDPVEDARQPFDVKFYLIAILFLIFDVELLFFFPWAVAAYASEGGIPAEPATLRTIVFLEMCSFLVLIAVAYIYEW